MKQKEATTQQVFEANQRVQQLAKKLQGLESTTVRKFSYFVSSFFLRPSFDVFRLLAAVPLPDVMHKDAAVRLHQVVDLAKRMCAALGMVCGTLYHGEEDLDATLDGVTKLLA